MPEEIEEFNNNNNTNNCEKIKLLADEYLHGDSELLDIDRKSIDEHLKICEYCAKFFAEEKKYLDWIKAAEYVPDISISESVMNKITGSLSTTAAGKLKKKRIIPFGLISAAAVVIIVFIAVRGGLPGMLNIFSKNAVNSSDSANNNAADVDSNLYGMLDKAGRIDLPDENENSDIKEYGNETVINSGGSGGIIDEAVEAENGAEAADIALNAETQQAAAAAPAPAAPEIFAAPAAVPDIAKESGASYIEPFETIWAITAVPGNIFAGIEIVESRDNDSLFIIQSKDKDAVIDNLIKEDIIYQVHEETGGDPEYIAVRLNLAYPTVN